MVDFKSVLGSGRKGYETPCGPWELHSEMGWRWEGHRWNDGDMEYNEQSVSRLLTESSRSGMRFDENGKDSGRIDKGGDKEFLENTMAGNGQGWVRLGETR